VAEEAQGGGGGGEEEEEEDFEVEGDGAEEEDFKRPARCSEADFAFSWKCVDTFRIVGVDWMVKSI